MELAGDITHTLISFFIIISVIVFIHEGGHFLVARLCGVKIDSFSIGFGKELFGWNDKHGTRWKFSMLPLGGYVKMFGDASAASTPDDDSLDKMSDEDKRVSFHHKALWKKALIVAAGPMANFLLCIGIYTWFMYNYGIQSTEPVAGELVVGGAAEQSGMLKGDRILSIDGTVIEMFNDIPMKLATNLGEPMKFEIERGEQKLTIPITPQMKESTDGLGNKIQVPMIGITNRMKFEDVGFLRAVGEATRHTYVICRTTLEVIGQIVTGDRGVQGLKGPVGIAKLSGQAAERDVNTVILFIAMLSANLGLMNLLPIPMLDGGHLAYYVAEAIRGKPLAKKVQEYGFRAGFAMLLTLMAFTVYNDVLDLFTSS